MSASPGGFSFDALPLAALVVDLDGIVLAANRAALIYAPGVALLGANLLARVPVLAGRWASLVETARTSGQAVDELAYDGATGVRHFQYLLTLVPEGGRTVGQLIAIDITEQRRADEAARARREAEQQRAVQERLDGLGLVAGGIAHDFNNLLVGVLAEASAAREDPTLGAPGREALRRIEAAARQMAQLTRQLLAYAGRADMQMRRLAPDALFDELREPLARLVHADAALAIAPDARGAVVEADATLLRQVIVNLVANASEAGSSRVELATSEVAIAGTRWWQLEIADDGGGIDPAALPRIFEPFFSTKHARHGLGLSAVHGIVRRLGGTIEVASRPGGGARFVVRLPIVPGAVAASRPPTDQGTPSPTLARLHVLVADDEPSVRASVRRLLERRGATVTVAADGPEAIACVRATRFGLVIVDVTMPGLSGNDVLIAVRAVQPGVPVLMMSGYSERGGSCEEEPDEFVEKPFTAATLDAAIARVLDR